MAFYRRRYGSAFHHFLYFFLLIFFILVDTYAQTPPQPISHWIFDATHIQGNNVLDVAGEFDAVVDGPVKFADAEKQRGLYFDGKQTRVVIGNNIGSAGLPTKEITVEGWINIKHHTEWGAIVGYGLDTGTVEYGWFLGNHHDRFSFGLSSEDRDDGDGLMTYIQDDHLFQRNHWYHVVGTYDGYRHALYVNGELQKETIATPEQIQYVGQTNYFDRPAQSGFINYPDYTYYVIGTYQDHDELFYMQCSISEVAIYDQALRADQINSRFQTGLSTLPTITQNRSVSNSIEDNEHAEVITNSEIEHWNYAPNYSQYGVLTHSVIEDRMGQMWFACINHLMKYENGNWQNIDLPKPYSTKYYNSEVFFMMPDGKLMLQTHPSPLILDPQTNKFQVISIPVETYELMWQGNDQVIHISNFNHIENELTVWRFDQDSFREEKKVAYQFIPEPSDVFIQGLRAVFPISPHNYLLGLHEGAYYTNNTQAKKISNLKNVSSILPLGQNRYWFGGNQGVWEWNGTSARVVLTNEKLEQVHSMIQTGNEQIWVAIEDDIYRYIGNDSWISYLDDDGLDGIWTLDLYEDSQSQVWAVSTDGVFIYNHNYDRNPPQTYVLSDDDANEYTSNSMISISFVGVDPHNKTPTERLQYSYKINQDEWSPFSHQTIFTKSGLKHGDYVFSVRALDSSGNIDPTPDIYQFKVVKEWYSQNGFYILCFIVFVLFVLLLLQIYQYHKRLYEQAVRDHLTQLFNRNYFDQVLELEFSRTKRYGKEMSLLLIDIDHFKSINDRYGHDVGDYVIAETAKRMKNLIRDIDTISRWGGEEFIILLPETDIESAYKISERLRKRIYTDQYIAGKSMLNTSISIGVAACVSEVKSVNDLLKRADDALYTAKHNGRNRVEVYAKPTNQNENFILKANPLS